MEEDLREKEKNTEAEEVDLAEIEEEGGTSMMKEEETEEEEAAEAADSAAVEEAVEAVEAEEVAIEAPQETSTRNSMNIGKKEGTKITVKLMN